MRLSTKGRYGVRAMFDLTMHRSAGPISVKSISRRQGISINYLEQIFNQLGRAGLIQSIRGPGGGFILSRTPGETKILDIIKALKEPIAPVACVDDKDPNQCERIDTCVTRLLWKRLGERIREVLENTSLEDLLKETDQLPRAPQPEHHHMFNI
ncbi:HTH-type transcriptional regulator CymR [subsurface metagenome]